MIDPILFQPHVAQRRACPAGRETRLPRRGKRWIAPARMFRAR
ncbi:hypothetical protein [Cognatishimia sp. F0-27]|nr:hypothetical protein [Cognatishimia sp. F0-27]